MKQLNSKISSTSTLWHIAHFFYVILLPVILFVCVNRGLALLAIGFIVLSKWRIFVVRPRYWLASVRANSVDITIGVSTVIFMTQTQSAIVQSAWAAAFAFWLLAIKTLSSTVGVSLQAFLALVYGLTAVYLAFGGAPTAILMLLVWAVCYTTAHHFLTSFEESHVKFLSNIFALFGASLAWILSHWLLFYGFVAQPTLFLIIISLYLGILYAVYKNHRLSPMLRTTILLFMTLSLTLILIFSDWSDKTL